jgi:hypothetical protein
MGPVPELRRKPSRLSPTTLKQEMLEVAVKYDIRVRELTYNMPSGGVGGLRGGLDEWTPWPRSVRGTPLTLRGTTASTRPSTSASHEHGGDRRGWTELNRYRRVVPCVALSVMERAQELRDTVLQLLQAHHVPLDSPPLDGAGQSPMTSPPASPTRRGARERARNAAEERVREQRQRHLAARRAEIASEQLHASYALQV